MIQYHNGDLLQSDCTVIAHGCNCFHTMGVGMAKSISDKYPGAFAVDITTPWGDPEKLGTFSKYSAPDGRIIYNLYTQYKYGRNQRHTDYDAVKAAFSAMRVDIVSMNIPNIKFGTYKIGCKLGGGDWNIVSKIIDDEMKDIQVHVYDLNLPVESANEFKERLREVYNSMKNNNHVDILSKEE